MSPECRVGVRVNGSCKSFKYSSTVPLRVILIIFHEDEINIFVF